MASEQLKTVLELVGSVDLGTLTLQERRALMGSPAAPPSEGTQVDPVDANGVPAEWVVAAGVTASGWCCFSMAAPTTSGGSAAGCARTGPPGDGA